MDKGSKHMKRQPKSKKRVDENEHQKADRETGNRHKTEPLQPRGRGSLPMPEGSGAVVLYGKIGNELRSVAAIPLKVVSQEPGQTPGWGTIENVLMPYQLVLGDHSPIWTDLLKFVAYKRIVRATTRKPQINPPENSTLGG